MYFRLVYRPAAAANAAAMAAVLTPLTRHIYIYTHTRLSLYIDMSASIYTHLQIYI